MLETEQEKVAEVLPLATSDDPIHELNKYNKRMDELIEDAEIESEMEAARKIRSKNTRLMTMSVIGTALLALLYLKTQEQKVVPQVAQKPEALLADLAEELLAKQVPVFDENGKAPDMPETRSEEPLPETPKQAKENKTQEPVLDKKNPEPKPPVSKKAEKPKTGAKRSISKPKPQREYFVQLGAFSVKNNAVSLSKRLMAKGFNPSTHLKPGQKSQVAVLIGHYLDEAKVASGINDLKAIGYSPSVDKNKDDSYSLLMGKFDSRNEAETMQKELAGKGFSPNLKSLNSGKETYIVKVGGFTDKAKAVESRKKMAQAGFKNSFIR
ncbi:MAG: SPOR domain-containing protein [Nitrospinota bacterium]|nr:SPOR domain-containing protein [Nitrospinota bacterium]